MVALVTIFLVNALTATRLGFSGLAVVWAASSVRPVNVRADAGLVSPNHLNTE